MSDEASEVWRDNGYCVFIMMGCTTCKLLATSECPFRCDTNPRGICERYERRLVEYAGMGKGHCQERRLFRQLFQRDPCPGAPNE